LLPITCGPQPTVRAANGAAVSSLANFSFSQYIIASFSPLLILPSLSLFSMVRGRFWAAEIAIRERWPTAAPT